MDEKDKFDGTEKIEEEEEKRTIVDSAYNLASKYKEDGVKFVKERNNDTKLSYIYRFLENNKHLVDDKFQHLLKTNNGKIEKGSFALAVDAMKSIGASLKIKEEQKLEKIGKSPVCVFDDGKTRRFKNVF